MRQKIHIIKKRLFFNPSEVKKKKQTQTSFLSWQLKFLTISLLPVSFPFVCTLCRPINFLSRKAVWSGFFCTCAVVVLDTKMADGRPVPFFNVLRWENLLQIMVNSWFCSWNFKSYKATNNWLWHSARKPRSSLYRAHFARWL